MIILSCYIYTNTILYTVEIYNPSVPLQWGTHQAPILLYIHNPLSVNPSAEQQVAGGETPGQCYII